MSQREWKDIRGAGAECSGELPVGEFMDSLEALQAEVATAKNELWPRVADRDVGLSLREVLYVARCNDPHSDAGRRFAQRD